MLRDLGIFDRVKGFAEFEKEVRGFGPISKVVGLALF